MDKLLILNKIQEHYNFKKDIQFAEYLGIPAQNLSKWKLRNTYDAELIYTKCTEINPEWLLTGEGEMLKKAPHTFWRSDAEIDKKITEKSSDNILTPVENSTNGIPLIPIEAMAGFGGGDIQVLELDCEFFTIPTFKGADFLIQVKGSSMYPKYNSGDIVACKKLNLNDLFFQWNKVYVLDTEQGALIKRIDIGADEDHVMIVSDNEKYRPFPLHKSKINAISIVMGVIRLE